MRVPSKAKSEFDQKVDFEGERKGKALKWGKKIWNKRGKMTMKEKKEKWGKEIGKKEKGKKIKKSHPED